MAVKYFTLITMLCLLAFVCVTPTTVLASETTSEDSAITEDNSADTSEDSGVSGTIGGLSFELNPTEDGTNTSWSATLQILLVLTVISLAPSILIMMTSFTRIIIVMHFVRSALGTQTTPPNQVLIGLALFLTLFIMSPVISEVNTTAVQPLSAGEITAEEAFDIGIKPVKNFMAKQIKGKNELTMFLELSGITEVESDADVPLKALIPAFILSELKTAFIIGFLIYIPFIIIDMVVASTLMSMGMMMLPPTTISMPFKILLFIMADGWDLIVGSLIRDFKT